MFHRMASVTTTTTTDDLDGSSPADTVEFGLDGKRYEIDLNDEHARQLEDALAPFIAAARKATGQPDKPAKPDHGGGNNKRRNNRDELAAIRQWVRDNGGDINDRGRIPQRIHDAYQTGDTSVFKSSDDEAHGDGNLAPAFTGDNLPNF